MFGRAPYYVIYDSETGQREDIPNPFMMAPSGAGIQAANLVLQKGVDAVVVGGFPGPNAIAVLSSAGIKILNYMGSVAEVIERAKEGLDELARAQQRYPAVPAAPYVYPAVPYAPYAPSSVSKDEEIRMLEEEKKDIEKRIKEIKERLAEIEKEAKK